MRKPINHITFVLLMFFASILVSACKSKPDKVEIALSQAGANRGELEMVINHYQKSGEKQKLKAAYYLIANLPGQYYFSGKGVYKCRTIFYKLDSLSKINEIEYTRVWDSLQLQIDTANLTGITKVKDIEVIKGKYLIDNIESAFRAWKNPWAKSLSFEEFCRYILPYKMRNEQPGNWRTHFEKKYKGLKNSLIDTNSRLEACMHVNQDLKSWFYFTKLNVPFDLSPEDLLLTRSGKCPQQVQMAAYAMRALGIPVTMDGVPYWPNRNSRHDWNALIDGTKPIAFLGAEINPTVYKLEFPSPGTHASKRAKIFRASYEMNSDLEANSNIAELPALFKERYQDVTADYIPVTSLDISLSGKYGGLGYRSLFLTVFNNRKWKPLDYSPIDGQTATFKDLGNNNIVYLPVFFDENEIITAGLPFILSPTGEIRKIQPSNKEKVSFNIDRKYPSGADNEIVPGQNYELYYWNDSWKLHSRTIATSKILTFVNVPKGALFWLKNLDKGYQERIFTVDKNKISWW